MLLPNEIHASIIHYHNCVVSGSDVPVCTQLHHYGVHIRLKGVAESTIKAIHEYNSLIG